MSQLPDFWRTEIWHPLSVHFPIALLLAGLLFVVIGALLKRHTLRVNGYLLIGLGTVGAWIAVFTGNLADGAVSRELCDPTVLERHERGGTVVALVFSAALLVIGMMYLKVLTRFRKLLFSVVVALLLLGSGYLVYTGHLGAKLVYQQAAGVYTPSEDCNEFVEE